MPDPYVYYLIRTKSTYNLCADSYISIVRCSFSQIRIYYVVLIQKIENSFVISVSLESEQFFNVACIKLVTRLMIGKAPYRMASNWERAPLTSKDTTKPLCINIFYIDRWGPRC